MASNFLASSDMTPYIHRRSTTSDDINTYKDSSLKSRHAALTHECTALVINSSHEMAKEITLALTLEMPNCSIMYAPTIQLARWILFRRKIDLVVSSAILPDGNIALLSKTLERLESPPDIVVVGSARLKNRAILEGSSYLLNVTRKVKTEQNTPIRLTDVVVETQLNANPQSSSNELPLKIRRLGADLRNDLNNPLQEIVAMVFVAQAGQSAAPATLQALEAIDRAAKGLAKVVKGLEEKILEAVG